jgi:hypothetical protein
MANSNDRQPQQRPKTPPATSDAPDPLAEAESLRAQLSEALARTSRLIALLKRHRKESQAVKAALASLRRLDRLGD